MRKQEFAIFHYNWYGTTFLTVLNLLKLSSAASHVLYE